jgi:hypothetical protein
MAFDGSGAHVVVPDAASLDPATALSVGAWVSATAWSTNATLLEKADAGTNDQYRLGASGSNLVFEVEPVGGGSPAIVLAPLPSTGAWHYIVGTDNGTTLTLYVDGVSVGTASAGGAPASGHGTIAANGTYTAPCAEGTFTVQATSSSCISLKRLPRWATPYAPARRRSCDRR